MQDYQEYSQWKNWNQEHFFKLDAHECEYLPSHFECIPLSGVKFLEIGFGNASKLAWAQSQGAKVYGTEIQPNITSLARGAGIYLFEPDLSDLNEHEGSFDVVAAFDVFEHISLNQVGSLLQSIERALKVGGVLVTRFPNAQSPFGNFIQHSDVTHLTALSPAILGQLLLNSRLKIEFSGMPVTMSGPFQKRLAYLLKRKVRSVVDYLFCRLYDIRPPLDPNIVHRIRKT